MDDKNPRKFMCCGSVNGTPVSTTCRDTGCSSVIISDSIFPDAITTNVPNVDVYDYLGRWILSLLLSIIYDVPITLVG